MGRRRGPSRRVSRSARTRAHRTRRPRVQSNGDKAPMSPARPQSLPSAPLSSVPARLASAAPLFATFALFACLSVVHTWPLASAPGRLSRNDNADTVLNEWTVAWVAHQVTHDPLHLLDANTFYPERNTLAYSEPLIVPAMIGASLLWLGESPVLVYNLLVLAGLTLT